MEQELEALIVALDAALEAQGSDQADPLRERFESLLEETSRKHGLPSAALESAVRFAYLRWLRAQQKPPTMPPSA